MILSDFHTHTNFVDGNHTPEEMVKSAIEKGMKTLGVSEHAYSSVDEECSMSFSQTKEYRKEIARLKEEYSGQIQLLCGIEMDFTSQDDPNAYDYVIGSVHYLTVGGKTYFVDYSPEKTKLCIEEAFGGDADAFAEFYFDKVAQVVETTGANIIGHFDLLTKFSEHGVGPDVDSPRYIHAWQSAMKKLAGKASLEINTGAISRGWRTTPYPSQEMLKFWKELGGSVVINSDSHHKDTLLCEFDLAQKMAESVGFATFGFTDKQGVFHQQSGEKL
jgi:histidinol-phosphatase (PHP family)